MVVHIYSHQSQIKPAVADIYNIAEKNAESGANYHNSPVLCQIKSTWKREREITQNNSKGRRLKIKLSVCNSVIYTNVGTI